MARAGRTEPIAPREAPRAQRPRSDRRLCTCTIASWPICSPPPKVTGSSSRLISKTLFFSRTEPYDGSAAHVRRSTIWRQGRSARTRRRFSFGTLDSASRAAEASTPPNSVIQFVDLDPFHGWNRHDPQLGDATTPLESDRLFPMGDEEDVDHPQSPGSTQRLLTGRFESRGGLDLAIKPSERFL